MVFGDDSDAALVAAAELVNSAEDPDTMTTHEQLVAFFDAHGYTGARPDEAGLAAVRAARTPLRRLLTSERDDAAALVNALLARYRAVPRLVRHGAVDYHWHGIEDDAPFADRVVVDTAMAMSDVIRADELSRLSLCADPTCAGVVVDLSRNRSRRFCSTACGNRVAVAAYRARRA